MSVSKTAWPRLGFDPVSDTQQSWRSFSLLCEGLGSS